MPSSREFAAILLANTLLGFTALASQDTARPKATSVEPSAVVQVTNAPTGAENLNVQWVKLAAPSSGAILTAVARPSGRGPFSVVVLLHGTHGFAPEYVQLAKALARNGVLAIAPCWFSGGGGAGAAVVSPPIACPESPSLTAPGSAVAVETVEAIVRAVRALPDARSDHIGLFGHSRGSGAALAYIMGSSDSNVRAAVLENGGYPPEWIDRASQVKVPVLILHGVLDPASDGGSLVNAVETARNFEAALRRAGRPVEAKYYDASAHNGRFTDAAQREDEVRRMATFFRSHLRR